MDAKEDPFDVLDELCGINLVDLFLCCLRLAKDPENKTLGRETWIQAGDTVHYLLENLERRFLRASLGETPLDNLWLDEEPTQDLRKEPKP
jgi:hypothetical protein